MAEGNGNGKGCPPYLKDPKFWVWCVAIVASATFAWATLKSDIEVNRNLHFQNKERIIKIEEQMPIITNQLSLIQKDIATTQNDVAWIKNRLK